MHQSFRDGFEKQAWEWANPEKYKAALNKVRQLGGKITPGRIKMEGTMNIQEGKRIADLSGHPDYIREVHEKNLHNKLLKKVNYVPTHTNNYSEQVTI